MIARYLTPSLAVALAVSLLVLWNITEQRDAALAERDAALAAYGTFRAETKAEAATAKAATAAEKSRLEKLSNDTRTAYEISMDRLRGMLAAERVRRAAAEGGIRAGGDRVPGTASATAGPDEDAADAGSGAGGASAAEEVAATLPERCAMATLQCAWLQHWAASLKPPDARP